MDDSTREMRALAIAATQKIKPGPRDTWTVPSQSGNGNYWVSLEEGYGPFCTCPDFETRGMACKHLMAVEIVMRRETTDGDVTVTEEVSVKVTYSQDWAAYNRAQCEEKDRLLPMLADLCSTIPQPEQTRGRPRLPMGDMAFAAIAKVYSGRSARRFDSDVRENKARGLTADDPHFNSVLRYLRDPALTPVLHELVALSALPLKGVERDFAIDSTGFSTCRYVRWYDQKYGQPKEKKEWVKLHAMCGVVTNIVTSVELTPWNEADSPQFKPLLAKTAERFEISEVSADKAYGSKANMAAVDALSATPYIPFKRNIVNVKDGSTWARMFHMFAYERDAFLAHYHKRSNVETTFSMIKAKFGDSLRSKSDVGQVNEVLCKVICHNLCVLISAIHELGLPVPAFSENSAASF
jgi:transposase